MITRQFAKQINADLLTDEFRASGINEFIIRPSGCEIHDVGADAGTIDAIIAAHDHTLLSSDQQVKTVADGAKTQAQAIPNWATWTEQQAVDWITANITDANTRSALAAMARMLVALRNERWPDLQGG